MEKQEILDSLDKLANQVEVLQTESGPKSNDFIKWVREVKQFIEKAFGADHPQLRAFKKIDYYPKQFDILSSESAFKKAWVDGLMQAKTILEILKDDVMNVKKEEPKPAEKEEEILPPKEDVKSKQEPEVKQEEKTENKEDDITEEMIEEIEVEIESEPEPEVIKPKDKRDRIVEKSKPAANGQKVLLVNISNEKLNEDIFKFVKKMNYEPVVIDQSVDGDSFMTDVLENTSNTNAIYAVIYWRGDVDCDGKKRPNPSVLFGTGYFVAKLGNSKVLIIHSSDIDPYDESYSGLNFLEIDDIQELMELKLAREMDSAGLNIDFNFLKKKK